LTHQNLMDLVVWMQLEEGSHLELKE
jgi:hypothetical protein